jgi:tetratricopeptide (TPR) repeat protein
VIRAAVLLLVALAAAPAAAARDPLPRAEEELEAAEARMAALERALTPPEETAGARAERRLAAGERRFRAGDFAGAAAALAVAVEDPELRRGPRLAPALWQLGESLARLGRPAAALARFEELLKLDGAPFRREALPRAMDCALRLGRPAAVPALLDAARAGGVAPPPPEALYLAAKAAYRRADRPPAERWPAALAALAQVPAPWHLHAAYFEGAIRVQQGLLPEAEAAFGRCLSLDGSDAPQRDVRELCRLALGRLASERGRWEDADRHYREIGRRSARFAEAVQEHAAAAVRAGRLDEAVKLAGLLPELQPESPLAPRSALLRGQIQLRLGQQADAVASFERVLRAYAPLRDELDRALAAGGEPSRWYAALAGAAPGRPEPPPLPRIALRWAAEREGVGQLTAAAGSLEQAQRELGDARRHASRIEGVLERNYGLGAFPALEEGYARAEAIETVAMRTAGALAAYEAEALAPRGGTALVAAREERRALEARVAGLPGSSREMAERQRRDRERLGAAGAGLRDLRAVLLAAAVAVDDVDVALSARPAALPRDRDGVRAELDAHRRIVAGQLAELDALAERVTRAADGAPRAGRRDEDALRAAYRAAVEKELQLAAAAARGQAPPEVMRADGLRRRATELEQRADRAKRAVLTEGRVRAAGLRASLREELGRLEAEGARLQALRAETERAVGAASRRVFGEVRERLHEVVLQADVGLADAAWAEKRQGVDRIQALSAEHARELADLERAVLGGAAGARAARAPEGGR